MFDVGNLELLNIIDAVAKEKGFPQDTLISILEQGLQRAAKHKYGQDHNIKVEINRKNGAIKLYRALDVVDGVQDPSTQISLKEAKDIDPNLEVGSVLHDPLPPIDIGRTVAGLVRQIVQEKVRDADREKQYQDFKDRVGEILNVTVRRIESGKIIVDLGRIEAAILKDQLIKSENIKIGDKIKAYLQQVKREVSGPQIYLSRTDSRFLAKLMEIEIPEIHEKLISIKSVARDPGSRAKVAVFAVDSTIDAIGSCIGVKGSRIKAVSDELNGEKIHVVEWSEDLARYVINALAPAEISRVVIDQDKRKIEVVVPNEQLSITIGKGGQNVKLASKLIGWDVDVLTEEEESKRRVDEFNQVTEYLIKILDVEEVVAQLLIVEGFTSISQIAISSIEDLKAIEGFDEELASELKTRALNYMKDLEDKIAHLGVDPELLELFTELSKENTLKLAEAGIKNFEDLAEMSVRELAAIIEDKKISNDTLKYYINFAKAKNK